MIIIIMMCNVYTLSDADFGCEEYIASRPKRLRGLMNNGRTHEMP